MNTVAELEQYGIDKVNAEMMLDKYRSHIGEEHGNFTITDMTYIGNKTRKIELTCSCGYRRTKIFANSRNKLSELPRICPRCSENRKAIEKEVCCKEKEAEKLFTILNEVGREYGDYYINRYIGGKYLCVCKKCGAIKTVAEEVIINHKWKSSKCTKHYIQPILYDESYIGRKNNMLEVVGISRNGANKKVFLCKCDCGKTTLVQPTIWASGKVKSCGCFQETRSIDADEKRRLLGIYRGMVRRCYNPKDKAYAAYGGRGITVCDEWLKDKESFLEWSFTHGYSNTLTIDRIDVNGNYSPENCRWATYKMQYQNCRPKKRVGNGETNR